MDKLVEFIKKLISSEYSGGIVIYFNKGGIRGIKKVKEEQIKL